MTYTIETVCGLSTDYIQLGKVSAKTAITEARNAAAKYRDEQVFLSWFRTSDGQRGYLNSDGSHDVTGRAY